MRLKAKNDKGYLDADVGDTLFTQCPGSSAHPVSYGRSGTVSTWSGGGVATIVQTSDGKTNHIDLNPLSNNEYEESTMDCDNTKSVPLPPGKRIRKLTPRECLRLMGYNDDEIDKLQYAVTTTTLKNGTVKTKPTFSNSAQYRFAGNSVVVDVFAGVLDCIVKDMENPNKGIDEW